MLYEGFRVAVTLEDDALGVVRTEVRFVLQSPGVLRADRFQTECGKTFVFLKHARVDLQSGEGLKFSAHSSQV